MGGNETTGCFLSDRPMFPNGPNTRKSVWCSGNIPRVPPFFFFAVLCKWVCVTVALVKSWNKANLRLSVGEWRAG